MFKKLNPIKRRIFKGITKSFKNKNVPYKVSGFINKKATKILIIRPNHRLGNQLLISPLIQEIYNTIPNCEIDLLVNGNLSSILYKNYSYVNIVHNLPKKPFKNLGAYLKTSYNVISSKYDIGISGCEKSNSGKIFLKLSRCKHKIYNSANIVQDKPNHIAKQPVYNFVKLNENFNGQVNYPKIDIKLALDEVKRGKEVINKVFDNNKKVIAIFTYATRKKKLSKAWWSKLYQVLQSDFSDFNILEILPKENVSQIDFLAPHYYSKDLREIAAVIENCELFIGADSGMMHLAVSSKTPTIGLFSITKSEVYEPYGTNNTSIQIEEHCVKNVVNQVNKILN